mmetsp:Transcript_37683/g.82754  ORF Transcript_37683/g.82754 Transcript_37683/m.82754 type:complete len:240 (+) Transcript_37683:86-805(+)
MATQSLEVTILRDLADAGFGGADWLECEDSFGIFYYHRHRQVASLELPRGLAAESEAVGSPSDSSRADAEPKILMSIGDWVIVEDDLGVFCQNTVSKESHDEPPPELVALFESEHAAEEKRLQQKLRLQQQKEQQQEQRRLELRCKWEQQYGQQCLHSSPQRLQSKQSCPLPSSQEAIVKMRIGIWAVATDSLGEFYQNMETRECFEDPPSELRSLIKQRIGSTVTTSIDQNMPAALVE